MNSRLQHLAQQFSELPITAITPLGQGLINDTYLVRNTGAGFVLQRINNRVFPQPQLIMANLQRLSQHIRQLPAATVCLRIPGIIPCLNQQPFYQDDTGQFWRALELIQPAESRQCLSRQTEAAQIGYALAHFHKLCCELPSTQLYDTLPGFHITPTYYRDYQQLLNQPLSVPVDAEFTQCRQFIENFADKIDSLENAKQSGQLTERVIHGDPKLNNFLFHPDSDQIVSLIDLDTVKPGLIHYDIGDCIRSCCHIRQGNRFNLALCRTILQSYLQEAGPFFSAADYAYLYSAIQLIPFELGLRFFSDYLAGNRYFKITDPRENLRKATDLFSLCTDITHLEAELKNMLTAIQTELG